MILVHECQYIDGEYVDVVDMREATGDEVDGFTQAMADCYHESGVFAMWSELDFKIFTGGTATMLPPGTMAQESSITKRCKVIFPDRN